MTVLPYPPSAAVGSLNVEVARAQFVDVEAALSTAEPPTSGSF
ncbi:hypothetical protein ACTD5D_16335 [Nocardia takedensis]|nr:hypothetical protein [Nocardia takedensis]